MGLRRLGEHDRLDDRPGVLEQRDVTGSTRAPSARSSSTGGARAAPRSRGRRARRAPRRRRPEARRRRRRARAGTRARAPRAAGCSPRRSARAGPTVSNRPRGGHDTVVRHEPRRGTQAGDAAVSRQGSGSSRPCRCRALPGRGRRRQPRRCRRSSRRRRDRETTGCAPDRSAGSSSARRRRTRACSACRRRPLPPRAGARPSSASRVATLSRRISEARGRPLAGDVDHVLDRDRDAVQRTGGRALGLGQRLLGPHGDERVELGGGLDPRQEACTASRGESSPRPESARRAVRASRERQDVVGDETLELLERRQDRLRGNPARPRDPRPRDSHPAARRATRSRLEIGGIGE